MLSKLASMAVAWHAARPARRGPPARRGAAARVRARGQGARGDRPRRCRARARRRRDPARSPAGTARPARRPARGAAPPGDGDRGHRSRRGRAPPDAHGPLSPRLPRGPLRRRRARARGLSPHAGRSAFALDACVELLAEAARRRCRGAAPGTPRPAPGRSASRSRRRSPRARRPPSTRACTRGEMSASKTSQTAAMRPASGISSPASPWGSPPPSQRSWCVSAIISAICTSGEPDPRAGPRRSSCASP